MGCDAGMVASLLEDKGSARGLTANPYPMTWGWSYGKKSSESLQAPRVHQEPQSLLLVTIRVASLEGTETRTCRLATFMILHLEHILAISPRTSPTIGRSLSQFMMYMYFRVGGMLCKHVILATTCSWGKEVLLVLMKKPLFSKFRRHCFILSA